MKTHPRHRAYYIDKGLLYVFSVNIEFELNIEEIGLVPGGARVNLVCVPRGGRVYNVLRERTVGAPGYPVVTGTIVWGEDAAFLGENDVAIANVRATIETDDGETIDTTYHGVLPLPMGVFRAIAGGADPVGTPEQPAEYPVVVTPNYETDSPKYRWLTELQCVGFGRVNEVAGLFRRVSYDMYALT
jgi:hypothetical protein